MDVLVGQEKMSQKVLVMETTAFHLILGMDFLSQEAVEGILFRPYARLVVNGKEYPLDEMKEEINWLRKMWITESYQLDPAYIATWHHDLYFFFFCSLLFF